MENTRRKLDHPQNKDFKQLQREQAIISGISFILFLADYPYTLGIEYLLFIFLGYGIIYFGLGFWDWKLKIVGSLTLVIAAFFMPNPFSYPGRLLALLILLPIIFNKGIRFWE